MVKLKIGKDRSIKVKVNGSAHDIAVEMLAGIKTVYGEINQRNPQAAAEFMTTMIAGVIDPKSPVWEVDHGKDK